MRRIQVSFYGTPEAGQGRYGLCVTERRLKAVLTTTATVLDGFSLFSPFVSRSFFLNFSVNHQRQRTGCLMAAGRCNVCHRVRPGHDVASRGGGRRRGGRSDVCSRRLELETQGRGMKCSFTPTDSASPSRQKTCASHRRVAMPLEKRQTHMSTSTHIQS